MIERAGMTLLELLIVLAIGALLAGRVALSLGGQDSRALRVEAERLAALVKAAQEAAILEGRGVSLSVAETGYEFRMRQRGGTFSPIAADDVLRPRRFPAGIRAARLDILDGGGLVLFAPTGEPRFFRVTLVSGKQSCVLDSGAEVEVRCGP
jgi:general secretion pathway protein H